MNKKPPGLPDIEDATLRACLAPLMDAMSAGGEMAASSPVDPTPAAKSGAVSNDNPVPCARVETSDGDGSGVPRSLAEWREESEDDFGLFRTIDLFLAMTDAELEAVAAEFPRQIGKTVERIASMKRRLIERYDMATTIGALLEKAINRSGRDV